jgi:hypothetical protein
MGRPRCGRSDIQGCLVGRQVATYLHSPFHSLTGEEQVAERAAYSRFFGTHAADRRTNGDDGILVAAMEDKRIEVSLYAPAEAQAAQRLTQPTPGRANRGTPTDLPRGQTRTSRTRNSRTRKNRETRDKEKARQHKKPEPEGKG